MRLRDAPTHTPTPVDLDPATAPRCAVLVADPDTIHEHEDWFAAPLTPPARRAVEVCLGQCPVRGECLRAAVSLPSERDHGILGGLHRTDRDRLRRRARR